MGHKIPDNPGEARPQKLRVLQIIAAPELGGIENQLLAFLERCDHSHFAVDVACTDSVEGTLQGAYLEAETELIPCRWSRYIVPFVWRLRQLLRRKKYDVLHARMSEVSGAALLAARLAGVPVRIASFHHTKIDWSKTGILNHCVVSILRYMTRRFATGILGISQGCLDTYYSDWRQYPEKFRVVYNGVDMERFSQRTPSADVRQELGFPAASFIVGHVGSFRRAKNQKILLEIASRVLKEVDNAYFLLVGDGALRSEVKRKAEVMQLAERFVFTGSRTDIPKMFAAMDVFVMPSLHEGFGTVAIEAQLSGLPVVASDLPCLREALCPSLVKFCRPPTDSAGMAEQVLLLLQNPHLRNTLGEQARQFVAARFSIDKTVRQLERIYRGTLEE